MPEPFPRGSRPCRSCASLSGRTTSTTCADSPNDCRPKACASRSTTRMTGCRRRSCTRSTRRCLSCSSPVTATSRRAQSRSATAMVSSVAVCRSTTRSSRSPATSPAGRSSRTHSTRRPSLHELEHQPGAGTPDAWQRIWMPERMAYIKGDGKAGCPFCDIPAMGDEAGLIVARGESVYAVLNLYPYNSGHLMVVPFRHVADYTELSDKETDELATYTKQAMAVLRDVSNAQGFNIGMNQGSVAGAGIAQHLHQHIVPRWGGDTNFMPVVARTKVLPQLLGETRALLAASWSAS